MIVSMGRTRQRIWDEMALHEPLDFEKGYMVLIAVLTCVFNHFNVCLVNQWQLVLSF
jgi:hypothetical protein